MGECVCGCEFDYSCGYPQGIIMFRPTAVVVSSVDLVFYYIFQLLNYDTDDSQRNKVALPYSFGFHS